MQIDKANLRQRYDAQGFSVLDCLFDDAEIAAIRAAAEGPSVNLERVRYEDDKSSIYIRYGIHEDAPVFARLVEDARCVEAAEAVLGEQVYLHQSKLNGKAAFQGSDFPWHQDLAYWQGRDKVPDSRILTFAVFVDDVTAVNAPLLVMPGSHREGLADTSGYNLSAAQVKAAADRYGIEAVLGAKGTALLFSGTLIHASAPNISPLSRRIVYLTYNAVSNVTSETGAGSPDFLACSDFTPITAKVGRLDVDTAFA